VKITLVLMLWVGAIVATMGLILRSDPPAAAFAQQRVAPLPENTIPDPSPAVAPRAPLVEPDIETVSAPSTEEVDAPHPVSALVEQLRRACAEDRRSDVPAILAGIRERLASHDGEVERLVIEAILAKDVASTRLRMLVYRYPDRERRAELRAALTAAASPAPAGVPDLEDTAELAAFLGGPASDEARTWCLRRLREKHVREADVLEALARLVLRSPEGGPVASEAQRALAAGPREIAEPIALRALEQASTPAARRAAVRMIGWVSGSDGLRRLVAVVRDDADAITRRLAALALVGKPLGATGRHVLRSAAEDPQEDRLVRQHARHALDCAELRRRSAERTGLLYTDHGTAVLPGGDGDG
jgi:hypothetical protein